MSPKVASPIWHPFTQHAVQPEATLISGAEGAWLHALDGRRIFDAVSSWWVVTHGHRNPHIVQAIKNPIDRLDQVIFAGFTHEPAETLARQLIAITPPELEYVFFSDSGSTSVEVALKMALGFWRHRGENRYRILALDQRGHGDTGAAPGDSYTTDDYVGGVERFATALGLTRFVLVGMSMGGRNSIVYTARHPAAVEKHSDPEVRGLSALMLLHDARREVLADIAQTIGSARVI